MENRFSITMWLSVLAIFGLCGAWASTVVDLSNRNLKKEDFFVKMQSQINLHNVTDLILRGNEFDSFLDCSTKLDNLKKLDLSVNHLQRFFFLCKEEYNLEVLNVSHNQLEYIDDYALNDHIPKLKVLDLSSNKLTVVNETMLMHMKILEYLSVANNPVIDIHDGAFGTLRALVHLDLSNVSTSYFPSALFEPLTNLTFLNLSRNPITTIPLLPTSLQELDLSNTEILYPQNLILPSLVTLWMNRMPNLTILELGTFENLTMLETLSLDDSKSLTCIRYGHSDAKLLPRLRHLSIRGCNIKNLDRTLWLILHRVPFIDLRSNPWHCDCTMSWMHNYDYSVELTRTMRCQSPEKHEGKLLMNIPESELGCDDDSSLVYSLVWVAVSIIIMALIGMGVFFLKKRPISQWKFPIRGGNTVTYKNVVESNNDLIRILNPGEGSDRVDE